MKKNIFIAISILCCTILAMALIQKKDPLKDNFSVAAKRYTTLLQTATDLTKYPHSINKDGTLAYYPIEEWTGGFWPGILWYMYEFTGEEKWKTAATTWTESLESNQFNTAHHDIGFMMYCSYGNALRFNNNDKYRAILIQSAKSLCKRYAPVVGSIQSWNPRKSKGEKHQWNYPVIMDNMMNLELLFYAAKTTGDTSFSHIAVRHAETTMKNHLRPDNSSYHVVNYDPVTGNVLHRQTLQGFSDNSTWARGQAWGIYGFTTCYRETKDPRFLRTACNMADFFLDHPNLPADKVPFWDFNAGQPGFVPDWQFDPKKYVPVPRDASAAAITCSALFELAGYANATQSKKYLDAAQKIMLSLSSSAYLNKEGANPFFLLKHSVGNLPSDREVDVPLIYADYYFIEAMLRYKKLKQK